jgi:hypothetical protein
VSIDSYPATLTHWSAIRSCLFQPDIPPGITSFHAGTTGPGWTMRVLATLIASYGHFARRCGYPN